MDDAAVAVPAFARQVERLALGIERHAEGDQPLNRARRALDDEFDDPAIVEPRAGDHRILDMAFERIARLEHRGRSEEHTSELQSLMRISYAVFCLKKTKKPKQQMT